MTNHFLSAGHYRRTLYGLGCSVLLFTLDLSIVNVALPTLTRELKTDFSTVQWVVLSYLMVVAAFLSAAARLGDLKDKKTLFLSGLGIFTLASFLCAVSQTINQLIIARALQGLGAVLVSALSLAIVTEISPPERRGQAIGTVGGLISLGVALGPSLGGLILGFSSWHWIFLVNVPIGIASGLLLWRELPPLPPPKKTRARFDIMGMLGLAAWLICLDVGLNILGRDGSGSTPARQLLLTAAVCFILLLFWEARHPSPIISLELFRNPQMSLGLGLALMVFVVLAGSLFLMPFFLENAMQYNPTQVGWLMAVSPVTAGLIAPWAGSWADRVGERKVTVVGLTLLALGCLLVSTFHQEMGHWRYVAAFLPFGLGVGIFQAPNNSSIMASAPPDRRGTASGLLALSRTLGQSLGLPLMAASFALIAHQGSGPIDIEKLGAEELVHGVAATFRGAGTLLLITALLVGMTVAGTPKDEAKKPV